MSTEINLETKLVGDITGEFYVPSYQRGYRWGETEVVRLLDDIYSTEGKRNYCLQPVVVRKGGDRYELIDGQQRLTTIYLIYRYMSDESFEILLYQVSRIPSWLVWEDAQCRARNKSLFVLSYANKNTVVAEFIHSVS